MATKAKKKQKKRLLWVLIIVLAILAVPFIINFWVVHSSSDRILTPENATQLQDVDCILVLGLRCPCRRHPQPHAG